VGMTAYAEIETLNRALFEVGTANVLQVVVDEQHEGELFARLRELAPVTGATMKRVTIDMFDEAIGETMLVMVLFFLALAGTMTFGMVYNNLRIALSERGRELATLRVLGFRSGEVSYMLFGEAGLLLAVGIPVGCAFGWLLSALMAASFETELIQPSTYGLASVITLVAVLPSVLLLQRRLSRLDLIAVLKTRE
jgi:putative ABC transport system permease protein